MKKEPMAAGKKRFRTGFTLAEILLVSFILSIQLGFLLLTIFSTEDEAKAVEVFNVLKKARVAALTYYMDHSAWPAEIPTSQDLLLAHWNSSMDVYLDRPLDPRYFRGIEIHWGGSLDAAQLLVGVAGTRNSPLTEEGVQQVLANMAPTSGLLQRDGSAYSLMAPDKSEVFLKIR